jgi:hypothetical protein
MRAQKPEGPTNFVPLACRLRLFSSIEFSLETEHLVPPLRVNDDPVHNGADQFY